MIDTAFSADERIDIDKMDDETGQTARLTVTWQEARDLWPEIKAMVEHFDEFRNGKLARMKAEVKARRAHEKATDQ